MPATRQHTAITIQTALDLLQLGPGGSPLLFDGSVAGAVGIAGGTPVQDAQIAEMVVARAAEL